MFRGSLRAGLALMLVASGIVHAQVGGVGATAGAAGASGGPGYTATEVLPAGAVISGVEVLFDDDGASNDAALEAAVLDALGFRAGATWDPVLGSAALARVRALAGVLDAALSGRPDRGRRGYRLLVQVTTGPSDAPARSGIIAGDGQGAFPTLYRGGRSYWKIELSGGHGLFSDGNPWFGRPEDFTRGNPLVEEPAIGADTGRRATWFESLLQLGIAGVSPFGDTDVYGFGAVTGIGVVSYGQDIFRGDTRSSFDLEKAYFGLLYAPSDSDLRLKLSLGRQNYTLNNGFLVSQFGSQWNAGPRPGVYLAPRTTQDESVVATAKYGDWTGTFFSLDPNELESIESDTRLVGLNLARAGRGRWSGDVSVLHVPRSNTRYRVPDGRPLGREGLWTTAAHVRMKTRPDRPDFWFEAELAHQHHDDFDMTAWAGYAELGYYLRDRRWTPSVSYRYAYFSGDDPETARYERFDTLYSGGLDHWLQGISINKLLTQANRKTHRLRGNIAPNATLNLTLDLYHHVADERNNLGGNPALGTLASRDLGQEIQLTARWQIRPNVFALGIVAAARPGRAIEAAASGDVDPWTTLQAQLFWGF